MSTEDILQDFATLPPEAQRQVADFIAFLLARYGRSRLSENPESFCPPTDTFIGMWRDRSDLQDSSAWVRSIRNREWGE
jgi:hypothetical protein